MLEVKINRCPLMKGKRNPRWNGGTSEYKDHYLMKITRKAIIKEKKGKCEFCGKKGIEIHHLDGTKKNHNPQNLVLCCHKCHFKIFHSNQEKKTSKYKRCYGMTLKQISIRLRMPIYIIKKYHEVGQLELLLKNGQLILF